MELSPNSRFSLSDNPNSLPGKCALCGSAGGDDRKFVDFGMQLDWYGAVYFCTYCVTELADAIGFVKQERFEAVQNEALENSNSLGQVETEFKEYRNAARALLRNCNCGDDLDDMLRDVRFGIFPKQADESAAKSDSDTDESGGIEGSSDVQQSSRAKPRSTKSKSAS